MISNNSLFQKTILAQILSYMDNKYFIYSTPHFEGFRRNLLFKLCNLYSLIMTKLKNTLQNPHRCFYKIHVVSFAINII